MIVHTILYVADQARSTAFYKKTMQLEPSLNVPGMTEFKLSESHVLGLMPESGIKKLLGDKLPDPKAGNGIPRVELYIKVKNPEIYLSRSLGAGAVVVSEIKPRDWGDSAGYVLDPDGHVLAFAC